jgi:hypothetical protein
MRASQIQRMGLALAQRHTALGFATTPRMEANINKTQLGLLGHRYIWSLSRFGKSLEQLAFGKKLRDLSRPKVDDGETHPIVEPIEVVVYPEQTDLGSVTSFWVSYVLSANG